MKALLEKMEVSDLPSKTIREVARQVGIATVKELMLKCGGMVIYIPKTFTKLYCRRYIIRHYNGSNVRQLAEDLGITERTVYRHLDAKM